MPSTRRWSVPPKLIAATAVLAVIGIFLVCGSAGMGSWIVGAIGVAVLAIGAGIFILSALNSRSTSEIEGTAHVISASAPPSGVTHGRCRLNLVLSSKGINGVGVRIRDDAVPVAKWPDAGTDLPVMIAIDKPQRTRVLWGDVPTHRESAEERARAREADERAAAMAAEDAEYANLDAALDDLDASDIVDAPFAEPLLTEPPLAEPLQADLAPDELAVAESMVSEPSIGESYLASGDSEPAMATTGTRTIEMAVMNPSRMRKTDLLPPHRPDGSRPSPYRRRRRDRFGPTDFPMDGPSGDIDESQGEVEDASTDVEEESVDVAAPQVEVATPVDVAALEAAMPVHVAAVEAATPVEVAAAEAQAPVEAAPTAVTPMQTDRSGDAPMDSAVMIDNGQIVSFDLLDPSGAGGLATGTSSRPAPTEWPLRSAAAAAAAAALPHQWDEDDGDDLAHASEPVDGAVADETAGTTTDGSSSTDPAAEDNFGSGARRVPRNRPAPTDELFDQDTLDDGPGYSPDTAYAEDTEYDADAGYGSDAGYAGPGQPNTAS